MAPYVRTSPSQRSTWDRCRRRWHYGSRQYLPQGESPYAAEGKEIHKQREDYQRDGKSPTHASVALTLDWTPPPGTSGIVIETKTTDPAYKIGRTELLLNGRIDYVDERNTVSPLVLDFKGKGPSFTKELRTEKALDKIRKQLEGDIQLNLYGAWILQKFPEAESVSYAHGYIGRLVDPKNPEKKIEPWAKYVETKPVPRKQILEYVATLEPGFEQMKLDAEADIESLPRNDDACFDYGERCPFYTVCKPTDGFKGLKFDDVKEEDVGLIDTLRKSPGASSIPDPKEFVGTTTVTQVPTEGAASSSGGALLRRLMEMDSDGGAE